MSTAPTGKRVLVIAPDLPYPCIGGGRRRMASIVDALASCATVRVVARSATLPPETEQWCIDRGCSIRCVDTRRDRLLRRITIRSRQIVSGDWQSWDARERRLLEAEIAAFQPDLLWVETPYQILYALRSRHRTPIVVDYWGTSEGAERILARVRGIRRLWHRYHVGRARRNERLQVPRLAVAVTVSDHCARSLQRVTGAGNIVTVPTALFESDCTPLSTIPMSEREPVVVLSGVMSFEPNVDAACWFVHEIAPLIRARRPDTRIVLAGAAPAPAVQALAVPGVVEVTGNVPDLQQRIAAAAVYALPMRLGSGIRTKLFDVFPTGTPIVTTTIGAEGFDLVHEESALFADDPPSFARACLRLLNDRALAQRIGAGAKRLAEERYTQKNVRAKVVEVIGRCFADGH